MNIKPIIKLFTLPARKFPNAYGVVKNVFSAGTGSYYCTKIALKYGMTYQDVIFYKNMTKYFSKYCEVKMSIFMEQVKLIHKLRKI